MIGFITILSMGHFYTSLSVLALSTICYNEILTLKRE